MENNIAQKILSKDLENIIKKVAAGKPLTTSERTLVEQNYSYDTPIEKYAKTTVKLANALGVTRQTISRWRKLPNAPKPLSNGKHDLQKWREFVHSNNLKEADTPQETELKIRKLLAEVKQAELKLSVMEAQYVSTEKVREVWTAHIGQVRAILESRLLNELPPILTALDAIQIREKMRDVLDEVYAAISESCDTIKDTVEP